MVTAALTPTYAESALNPCARCHGAAVEAYLRTSMGRSFGEAAPMAGARQARGVQVTGTMHRLADTAARKVDYRIGSGDRGSSFLLARGDALFQSPVSWYGAARRWDLSPGYSPDMAGAFRRRVTDDCLFCHTSTGRQPIGCERCHGPTAAHLAQPTAANIVNPAKLSAAARDSVCEQCHLAGEARIPHPGRSFDRFAAGQPLEDTFTVYVRAGAPAGNQPLRVVSHSEQLAASRCAAESGGRLWCGTCHNPHRESATVARRTACQGCHRTEHARKATDCSGCHMPKRGTWDGSHTAFTDHRIARRPAEAGSGRAPVTALVPWREPPPAMARRGLGLAFISVAERDGIAAHGVEGLRLLEGLLQPDPAVDAAVGLALLRRQQAPRALPRFARAAAAQPDSAEARTNHAAALAASGRFAEAKREAAAAIRLDAHWEAAYRLLAELHALEGNAAERDAVLAAMERMLP